MNFCIVMMLTAAAINAAEAGCPAPNEWANLRAPGLRAFNSGNYREAEDQFAALSAKARDCGAAAAFQAAVLGDLGNS